MVNCMQRLRAMSMDPTPMLAALATVMKMDWQLWMESQNPKYRPTSCMPRFAHPIEIILCKPTWDMYVAPIHTHPPRCVLVREAGGTNRLQRGSKLDLPVNR